MTAVGGHHTHGTHRLEHATTMSAAGGNPQPPKPTAMSGYSTSRSRACLKKEHLPGPLFEGQASLSHQSPTRLYQTSNLTRVPALATGTTIAMLTPTAATLSNCNAPGQAR